MKEKIGRLSRGVVDMSLPVPITEPGSIEITIPYGSIYRGDFRIRSGNQFGFRGYIYSSNPRVTINPSYFSGINTRVAYEVDPAHLEAGEIIEGSFTMISNGGEFTIPYSFTLAAADSFRQGTASLAGFAALASRDRAAALAVFESSDMIRLPFMQNLSVRAVYDGLKAEPTSGMAMDEFLIGTGAMEPMQLSVVSDNPAYYEGIPQSLQPIVLARIGDGAPSYRVSCDADFVRLSSDILTERDFSNGSAYIRPALITTALRPGENKAQLVIENVRDRVVIDICVALPEAGAPDDDSAEIAAYEEALCDLLSGCGQRSVALSCMKKAVLAAREKKTGFKELLMEVEYSQLSGDMDNAGELLKGLEGPAEEIAAKDYDLYVYYRYLQYMQNSNWETREKFLNFLGEYQERGVLSDGVFLLQLRADDSMNDRPTEVFSRMKEFYAAGHRSSLMNYEACRLFGRIPDLLRRLGSMEIAAVRYGIEKDQLSDELRSIILNLAEEAETIGADTMDILKLLYERTGEKKALELICRQLLADEDTGSCETYVDAVKQGIKFDGLYDAVLASMPEDYARELPAEIYRYYVYHGPDDRSSMKKLYYNVASCFGDDTDTFREYEEQILDYVAAQMMSGRVDSTLAVIYNRVIDRINVDERMARILPDILLTCKVDTGSDKFERLVVIYEEILGEQTASLVDGAACLPLYTDSYHLFFIDAQGCRYAGIPCEITKLLPGQEELLASCEEKAPGQPMLRLAEAKKTLRTSRLGRQKLEFLREMSDTEGLHPLFRSRLVSAILKRGQWEKSAQNGDILLASSSNREIADGDRPALIRGLAAHGYYEDVWSQIRRYGYSMLDNETLLKIVRYMIEHENYEKDAHLLMPAYELYCAGVTDDVLIRYLCMHFAGLSTQLLEIMRTAEAEGIDMSVLPERLLGQMLFTNCHEALDEVFRLYTESGVSDKIIVNAYFTAICDRYFRYSEPMGDEVVRVIHDSIAKEILTGGVPVIWQLALLKIFADQKTFSEEDRYLCREMIGRMSQKNIFLPYFKKLSEVTDIPAEFRDKTMISFNGCEDDSAALIIHGRDGADEYRDMTYVYAGIFTASILLFEGEEVDYEIRVTRDGETFTAARGRLRADITGSDERSRFGMLNRLVSGNSDTQDPEWQESIRRYAYSDALTQVLFKPI